MLTNGTILQTTPEISQWGKLLTAAEGTLFNTSLREWQNETRGALGLETNSEIVVVGHQPMFFHPGILAKFVAASEFAKVCNAKLVHLVVDHHVGDVGTIEIPNLQDGVLQIEKMRVAQCEDSTPLCDQNPLEITTNDARFVGALNNDEQNAAMQIAEATGTLMKPYAAIDCKIAATDLCKTPIGEAVIDAMFVNKGACIAAYNEAVGAYPKSGVPFLAANELPVWGDDQKTIRPRALLLTLLARLGVGNLFVHGTGGAIYDRVMERWCQNWLGVDVCPQVMATATMTLPFEIETIASARHHYFSGDPKKKQSFLSNIDSLPRGSSARQVAYLEMHRMFAALGVKPNHAALMRSQQIARKRDWAFPLYGEAELQKLTKDLSVPKLL
ncbi:MAG: hypothetical protein H8E91_04615 [Planctomycetes bacterium]|nr:hypothetical protein [Planctomycetota bacterium]